MTIFPVDCSEPASDLKTNAYGPMTPASRELGWKILEEDDQAEAADHKSRQVGFFCCRMRKGRNSERPFVLLFSLGSWRQSHFRACALGAEPLLTRAMTSEELAASEAGARARSTTYATLAGLLRDEWTVTRNAPWCGELRVAYMSDSAARRRITDEDWELSGEFVRGIIAKEKNSPPEGGTPT